MAAGGGATAAAVDLLPAGCSVMAARDGSTGAAGIGGFRFASS